MKNKVKLVPQLLLILLAICTTILSNSILSLVFSVIITICIVLRNFFPNLQIAWLILVLLLLQDLLFIQPIENFLQLNGLDYPRSTSGYLISISNELIEIENNETIENTEKDRISAYKK